MSEPTIEGVPAPVWLTPERVAAMLALDLTTWDPADVDALTAGCAGAGGYVVRNRPDVFEPDGTFTGGGDVLLGAAMLAHRWYQRRSSPLGVAQFSEFDGAGMLRHDPDIVKLLGIGVDGRFTFGAAGYTPPDDAA